MTAGSAVFLFVLVLATGFFSLNVQRLVSYLRLGYVENRTDHPLTRVKNVLVIGIAQKKIFRDPIAGPMHALIFWGFMVLTAGTVEIVLAGVWPAFSFAMFLPKPLKKISILVEKVPWVAAQYVRAASHVPTGMGRHRSTSRRRHRAARSAVIRRSRFRGLSPAL